MDDTDLLHEGLDINQHASDKCTVVVDWDMYAHALCGGGGSYWSSCICCVGML